MSSYVRVMRSVAVDAGPVGAGGSQGGAEAAEEEADRERRLRAVLGPPSAALAGAGAEAASGAAAAAVKCAPNVRGGAMDVPEVPCAARPPRPRRPGPGRPPRPRLAFRPRALAPASGTLLDGALLLPRLPPFPPPRSVL